MAATSPTSKSPKHGPSDMSSFEEEGYVLLGRDAASTINNTEPSTHGLNPVIRRFPMLHCKTITRLVNRDNGRTNINHAGVNSRWLTFIKDNFTTLVNAPWYAILLFFGGTYILSWLVFAGVWTVVAKFEGDFGASNITCLNGVSDFNSALLFSIETQVTIGYGNAYINKDCTTGLFVLIFQCVMGLILDAILLGLLFTKITRPRSRRKTILFSNKVVLYEEDGHRYMEFRVGNLRKSQIAECHVRLVLYWYRDLGAGCSDFQQHDLQCGYENGTDRVVLITPAVVRHRIDQTSPLNDLSFSVIQQEDLEVVVVLEGIVETTGLTLQALWSYTNEEMVRGNRLRSIVSREGGKWKVNFSRFDEVVADGTSYSC